MFKRELKNFNSQCFRENLHQSFQNFFDQNNDINLNNFNKVFSDFADLLNNLINYYAPLKKISRRQCKSKLKSWITRGVFTLLNIYKGYINLNGSSEQKCYYKEYANKLTKVKLISKTTLSSK